ncbi:Ankyrin-2 [Hyphodiscus hymeniophilus]|uniref:Ankyrin-2 n=1 Tax=Hyphodiscus hymeniophilus TaxID=353542 RepID=A0A9P6VFL5_9HELO|nr:Ankyrin-2 [Hyphodiscus hymeniophilus]
MSHSENIPQHSDAFHPLLSDKIRVDCSVELMSVLSLDHTRFFTTHSSTTYTACSCEPVSLTLTPRDSGQIKKLSEALRHYRHVHRLERTGEWLFEHDTFNEWLGQARSSIIWLKGSPGTGKSMLSSAVLEKLDGNECSDDIVFFWICDGRFEASQWIPMVLSNLVEKLLSRNVDRRARDRLAALAADLAVMQVGLSVPDLRYALSIIKHGFRPHETLFLVLDGLDDNSFGQNWTDTLHTFFDTFISASTSHRVKIFISSRPNFAPCLNLGDLLRIDMDLEPMARLDFHAYVRIRAQKLQLLGRSSNLNTLAESLMSDPKATFLTAGLILRNFTRIPSPSAYLGNVLSTRLPMEISQLFDNMLDTILDKDLARNLFTWATYSARPLSLQEFEFLLQLSPDTLKHNICETSGGLLVIGRSQTINFIHLTARDHFLSLSEGNLYWPGKSSTVHENIFQMCLKALRSEPYSQYVPGLLHSSLEESFRSEAFLFYAKSTTSLQDMAVDTIRRCGSTYSRCLRSRLILGIAAELGLEKLARLELQMGGNAHLSCSSSKGPALHPLHLAAMGGHLNVVRVLLQYGVDHTTVSPSGRTALFYAVSNGFSDIMRLLLTQKSNAKGETSIHAIPRATRGPSEQLRLVAGISDTCTHCTEKQPYYIISKPSRESQDDNLWPSIHVIGAPIPEDELLLSSELWPLTSHQSSHRGEEWEGQAIIKWLAGADMYHALRIAARRGMGIVRDLLLAADNDRGLIDSFTSVAALVSKLRIS